jgi:tetratricopeptide (TPR) repeat protein
MDRVAAFKAFVANQPDDPFPVYSLAMELRNQEDHDQAQTYFDLLRDKFPDYLAGYFHAGANLTALGRKQEAAERYREGIDKAGRAGDAKTRDELQVALAEVEGTP